MKTQPTTQLPASPPLSSSDLLGRWDKTFREAHLHSWPTASLSIQNAKPTHETARNIFKEDGREIMAAAQAHGYRIVSPPKSKVVSFVRPNDRDELSARVTPTAPTNPKI
jgi:hypothetical protein